MLRQLVIRDLVVIESLNLEFEPGMNVLTGETGAGKSILVDALGLILGDRADTSLIREGSNRAEITAVIDICGDSAASNKLTDLDIEHEREVFLRRTISPDDRSRAYINGTPVPVQSLRELGELLVDIHSQHAHQSLLKRDIQRQLLDHFGGYSDLLHELHSQYQRWHSATSRLDTLCRNQDSHEDQLALLEYQLDELASMNLSESGYQDIVDKHTLLANANRIVESAQHALNEINQDENAISGRIAQIYKSLHEISEFDPALKDIPALLDNALIQIDEAANELRHYLDHIEIDPEQLRHTESLLEKLHETARKHKVHPKDLFSHSQTLSRQLQLLKDNSGLIEELREQQQDSLAHYHSTAKELHRLRKAASAKLAEQVSAKMHEMGMQNGKFMIEVNFSEDSDPASDGLDNIEFQVAANPGQPLKSIRKVASGGELSRISLAIQIIASRDKGIPIMIFDEVDAGIGGGVAETVGQLLLSLGEHKQVLCVTHLAQVASCGQHHYQVNKLIRSNKTYTEVNKLNAEERIDEIARMLGGIKITSESRAHASEMLHMGRENSRLNGT